MVSTALLSELFYLCPRLICILTSTKHFNFAPEVCQLTSESFTLIDLQQFQIWNFAEIETDKCLPIAPKLFDWWRKIANTGERTPFEIQPSEFAEIAQL